MAISPKALASWGLLSDSGGGIIQVTQVLQEMEISWRPPSLWPWNWKPPRSAWS